MRLEPYEGKPSSTVLRRERRSNPPDPADLSSIAEAAIGIDAGRKGFAVEGKERKGRILYEDSIAKALSAFQKAQTTADPKTIILTEYTFISQEFEFCTKDDKDTLNSLNNAIQSFEDAFLILEIVEDKILYNAVDKSYPHHKDYRINSFPKDSLHIACGSHKTRIKNMLRTPGIDPIEKALLKQRLSNLTTAQNSYIEKQKKVLTE